MNLLTPDPGLVFWTGITFVLLVYVLKKYAWRPILHAVKVREHTIKYALVSAEKAKKELENIENLKQKTLEEAAVERDKLLTEARKMKTSIIESAKSEAQKEADKIIEDTRLQLEKEKKDALQLMKEQIAELSVDIAGKLLEQELQPTKKQEELINRYLKEMRFN